MNRTARLCASCAISTPYPPGSLHAWNPPIWPTSALKPQTRSPDTAPAITAPKESSAPPRSSAPPWPARRSSCSTPPPRTGTHAWRRCCAALITTGSPAHQPRHRRSCPAEGCCGCRNRYSAACSPRPTRTCPSPNGCATKRAQPAQHHHPQTSTPPTEHVSYRNTFGLIG
jgi:hypothetical protein